MCRFLYLKLSWGLFCCLFCLLCLSPFLEQTEQAEMAKAFLRCFKKNIYIQAGLLRRGKKKKAVAWQTSKCGKHHFVRTPKPIMPLPQDTIAPVLRCTTPALWHIKWISCNIHHISHREILLQLMEEFCWTISISYYSNQNTVKMRGYSLWQEHTNSLTKISINHLLHLLSYWKSRIPKTTPDRCFLNSSLEKLSKDALPHTQVPVSTAPLFLQWKSLGFSNTCVVPSFLQLKLITSCSSLREYRNKEVRVLLVASFTYSIFVTVVFFSLFFPRAK